MGIAPYKYFTFDGASSRLYDVYLTGEGVFNAPERAVNMIEIPGRNGNYALDQGKFENITVTYKAGIVDASESNFADKMSAVRNWLCSKVGYKRLEDDYNPNEFRMAVFKSGVKVDHEDLSTGEFEITFDCKPQRWLTSGETATAVANNGTLSNPTLFESEPLLAVKGYGDIHFNGYTVSLDAVTLGDILLYSGGSSASIVLDESNLNIGDSITVNVAQQKTMIRLVSSDSHYYPKPKRQSESITDSGTGFSTQYNSQTVNTNTATNVYYITSTPSFDIVGGTNSSVTNTVSGTVSVKTSNNQTATVTFSFKQNFTYTASTHTLSWAISDKSISSSQAWLTASIVNYNPTYGDIVGHSTKSALGNPTYIDCEIGECYMYNSANEIVSLNGNIDLGSDLPKLSSGTNTFTYDNTVTELKVTPRWWNV